MSTKKLTNISPEEYRRFLLNAGCTYSHTKGGHEHWEKEGATRPITFQTHIDPVPEFIIKNGMRTLGIEKKDFHKLLTNKP